MSLFSTCLRRAYGGAFALFVLAAMPAAHAQNLLVNGSFELGNFTGVNPQSAAGATQLVNGDTNMTGWTVVAPAGRNIAWIGTGNPYNIVASEGARSLDLTGYSDASPYGGVVQTLATSIGATYRIEFDLGGPLANDDNSLTASAVGVASQTFFFDHTPASGQQWQRFGFNFVANSSATQIQFTGISTATGVSIGLDNTSVTLVSPAAAPEPGTLALLAGTLVPGALLVGRRRFNRA